MEAEELRKVFRERVGIRIGPKTGEYVLGRLIAPPDGLHVPIPVMGGDARTGAAIRTVIDPALLRQSAT